MNIAVLIPTDISFVIDMYMKQCLYFYQVGARTLYACAEKNKIRIKSDNFPDINNNDVITHYNLYLNDLSYF